VHISSGKIHDAQLFFPINQAINKKAASLQAAFPIEIKIVIAFWLHNPTWLAAIPLFVNHEG
jgi:hypothetical protein